MSIQESVAQLRALNFDSVMGLLSQSTIEIDNLMGLVTGIMGDGAAGHSDIIAALQEAKLEVDGALNAVQSAEGVVDSVASRH